MTWDWGLARKPLKIISTWLLPGFLSRCVVVACVGAAALAEVSCVWASASAQSVNLNAHLGRRVESRQNMQTHTDRHINTHTGTHTTPIMYGRTDSIYNIWWQLLQSFGRTLRMRVASLPPAERRRRRRRRWQLCSSRMSVKLDHGIARTTSSRSRSRRSCKWDCGWNCAWSFCCYLCNGKGKLTAKRLL